MAFFSLLASRLSTRSILTVFIGALLMSGCVHQPKIVSTPIPAFPPPPPVLKNIRVALVLGGGGSRGLAHVGVLEVLERHKVPVDLIIGTSAGSIVGALYADQPHAQHIKEKLLPLRKKDILDPSISLLLKGPVSLVGPIEGAALQEFLDRNLSVKHIEKLKIPFIAVASDIHSHQSYSLRSGPIVPAVNASAAIPPFFSPLKMYGKTLVDGGVIEPVPVRIAKQFKPRYIIAVDISSAPDRNSVYNMLNLTYWALTISYNELAKMQSQLANSVIHPVMDGFGVFDDNKNEEIYQAGRRAAEVKIGEIVQRLKAEGIM